MNSDLYFFLLACAVVMVVLFCVFNWILAAVICFCVAMILGVMYTYSVRHK